MPLPHELSARTPTTSTAYRSAESCTGQRPEMPVLMLRPYSSAESSASPAAHKDADKRIGLHGRLDHPPNLGQDTSLQTQLGSYQRYQIDAPMSVNGSDDVLVLYFPGLGECCSGWGCWVRTRQGRATPGGGQALIRSRGQRV